MAINWPWNSKNYPLDLDISTKVERFETGANYYPYPSLSLFPNYHIESMNNAWLLQSQAATPYGPNVTTVPLPIQYYGWNPPGMSKYVMA
jgi:hypothetical protein